MGGFRVAAEEEVEGAEPEKAERGDGEPHDRAAEEGDGECFVAATGVRRDGGADVRAGRGGHADEAGRGGGDRTRDEGEGRLVAEEEPQHDDEHEAEPGEHRVLAAHEDHRPEVDLLADLGHLRVPGRVAPDPLVDDHRGDEADDPEQRRNESASAHAGFSVLVGCRPLFSPAAASGREPSVRRTVCRRTPRRASTPADGNRVPSQGRAPPSAGAAVIDRGEKSRYERCPRRGARILADRPEPVQIQVRTEACVLWGFRGCLADAGRPGRAREAVRRGAIEPEEEPKTPHRAFAQSRHRPDRGPTRPPCEPTPDRASNTPSRASSSPNRRTNREEFQWLGTGSRHAPGRLTTPRYPIDPLDAPARTALPRQRLESAHREQRRIATRTGVRTRAPTRRSNGARTPPPHATSPAPGSRPGPDPEPPPTPRRAARPTPAPNDEARSGRSSGC